MARLKKRKKQLPFLLTWKPAAILGAFIVLLGFIWVGVGKAQDATYKKLLGDERSEVNQNTIPPDVQAWLSQGGGVLGASTDPLVIKKLPKDIHVPMLMYHYVEYVQDKGDTIRQSLDTTPYTLEEEIKTLIAGHYTFMTNAEVAEVLDGKIPLPPNPIALTFDDGYRDFYTDAYPILQKYHVKATAYIISGFLGYPNNMDAWMVKQIADDGLVEIAAHTVDHPALKGIAPSTLVYEVNQSKKTLEALIGKPVVSFAYPYGSFDVAAIRTVSSAGFSSAVSTVPGIDQYQTNRFFFYRLRTGGLVGQGLLSWLDGVKDSQVSYLQK
jgi:peptidoglycan/xylan/chitin deacetylase (PgdA/CDA1 family)